jgi:hypothetical protein
MQLWTGLLLWGMGMAAEAALAGDSRTARTAAWLALALLPLPVAVDASPLARGLLGCFLIMNCFRSLDLRDDHLPRPFLRRLLHLAIVVDSREMTLTGPRFNGTALLRIILGAVAAYLAIQVTIAVHIPWRWVTGGAFVFALFEISNGLVALLAGLAGVRLPPLANDAWRATSLTDFWSRRWNLVISRILRARAFDPLARRSLRLALFAAFALSALLHAYLGAVAIDANAALLFGLFFLAQVPLMVVERTIGVRRWHPAARWAWTFGSLALTAPLFMIPGLRVFGFQ